VAAAMGLLYGFFYLNQVEDSWRNTLGLLFAVMIGIMITCSCEICLIVPVDFPVIIRECYSGCNTTSLYLLGLTIASTYIIYLSSLVLTN